MHYISTRDKDARTKSFSEVLMAGLAEDGGLYVPSKWPRFEPSELKALQGKPYAEIAFAVLERFVGDDIPKNELKALLDETYGVRPDGFRHESVAPLVELGPNKWSMELFHGPTLAFKDVALQLLGRLFGYELQRQDRQMTIIGATSGDTGSAAIEGCKNTKNARIFILHPHGRTSDVQRRQMTTVDADNVYNIALKGTFDDCQNIVKALFADEGFKREQTLSAVNSINWARIIAQTVYYVSTSLALGAPDRPVQFIVPTGNFGNIFAAYSAMKIGVPIEKLVVASNSNDILTRFFGTYIMEMRGVSATLSPSMDIQISSNFERYLFDLMGRDAAALSALMAEFKETGRFSLPENARSAVGDLFKGYAVHDAETVKAIQSCFKATGIALDPHSAVGYAAMQRGLEDGSLNPDLPSISLACAHPAKFPQAVQDAIGLNSPLPPFLADLYDREERYEILDNDINVVKSFIAQSGKSL